MKKKLLLRNILLVLGIIVLLLGGYTGILFATEIIAVDHDRKDGMNFFHGKHKDKDTYDQILDTIKDKYPTDIMVYGDELEVRESSNIRYLDHLDGDSLKTSKKYYILVLNNMKGDLDLSQDDFDLLYQYVVEGNYPMIYISNPDQDYISEFQEKGFYEEPMEEDSCGFLLRHEKGELVYSDEFWDSEMLHHYEDGHHDRLGSSLFLAIIKILDAWD